MDGPPQVVVIARPNGAGKTTASEALLKLHGVKTFVNADRIASGLSGLSPEDAAIEAGIIMLERLRTLASRRESFGFETTLAARSYAPWLRNLLANSFRVHLHFLWTPSADFAVERVRQRVRSGGHDIPEPTIRRRYDLGLQNFFEQYRTVVSSWAMWDNSVGRIPVAIARRVGDRAEEVLELGLWQKIESTYAPA